MYSILYNKYIIRIILRKKCEYFFVILIMIKYYNISNTLDFEAFCTV